MTKEKIINKYVSSERRVSDFDQAPAYDWMYMELANARAAMDEYAKQQILAFSAWTDEEGLYQCGDGIWKTLKPECNTEWNHEEVYNQFIEQQNKASVVFFKEGDYVHYTPTIGPKENGRIKSINGETAFVVYKCNEEWDHYQDYTGCGTDISQLSPGWINGDHPKS